jgi:hypothetical protein
MEEKTITEINFRWAVMDYFTNFPSSLRGIMPKKFSDPIAPKNQKPKDHPKDGKSLAWDFTCPQYDERTSCFINAGTDYGVGHRQPVGHKGEPKQKSSVLPTNGAQIYNTDGHD